MPLAPDVMLIQLGAETLAVHAQFEGVATLKVPEPPRLGTLPSAGFTA